VNGQKEPCRAGHGNRRNTGARMLPLRAPLRRTNRIGDAGSVRPFAYPIAHPTIFHVTFSQEIRPFDE